MNSLHASGVYSIVNTVDEKRYIGSTSRTFIRRWYQHRRALRSGKHHSLILQRAWNKYGEGAFEFSVLEFSDADSCLVREQFYIDKYDAANCLKGYNIAPFAGSNRGAKRRPHSSETRAKMSMAAQNRSPEVRTRISEAARNMRPELRAKITASASKPRSLETRARMSAARHKLFAGPMGETVRGKLSAATTLTMTPERYARLAASRRGGSPSEETRIKMSISARNRVARPVSLAGKKCSRSRRGTICQCSPSDCFVKKMGCESFARSATMRSTGNDARGRGDGMGDVRGGTR